MTYFLLCPDLDLYNISSMWTALVETTPKGAAHCASVEINIILRHKLGVLTAVACTMQTVEVAPEVDFAALAARTDGYSGDDITGVCRDAAMNSLRRQIRGKSQAELVAMRDRVVHEPVNIIDFQQARPICTSQEAPFHKQQLARVLAPLSCPAFLACHDSVVLTK